MKSAKTLLMIAPAMLISGCLFFTAGVRDADIASLDARIQTINQRIDQLEASREVGTAGAGAASFAASTAAGAAYDTAAVSTAGPGVPVGWWPLFSWRKAGNKLARGVTNLLTGWVEIPKRVNETTNQSGAFSGFTWGLARGLGYGFVRTIAGGYETITFPFPAPPDYQPVIQPPYVFSTEQTPETLPASSPL